MEATSSYLLMLPKYINSKQKTAEIKDYTQCLGNISKNITINKIKKQDIKGSGFFFFIIFFFNYF